MAKIRIPTALRKFTEGSSDIEVHGATVAAALTDLTARYPQVRQQLFSDAGDLRRYVNLYLNQDDIRYLDGIDTALAETDLLVIVPALAGG